MKDPRVIVIAQNQPLDTDAHLRRKLADAEERAERQSARFPDLDLSAIQKGVHRNIMESLLFIDGRYMDLLDLMNFVRCGRHIPEITPENVTQHYSLANTVTLNGIYLYQYLLAHGYDPVVVQNYATADLPGLLEEDPLAVCISSNFIFMNDINEMGGVIKRIAPHVPVIAGGMLVKKVLNDGERFSDKTLDFMGGFHGHVDAFVVEAMGEATLVKLLAALRQGRDLDCVPNLAYFNGEGRMVFTPREQEEIHMDQTAIAWDRVPKNYLRNILPVNSSRGCYYRCRFCTYHWLFPKVHYKSMDVLKDELKRIDALGSVTHVRFTDDNFTANRERMTSVLEMMVAQGFGFTWSSFARASALRPELVRLMKASGCEFVDLGLESGSQTILDNMDKRLEKEQSLKAIQMLNDNGIESRGSFIIGYPGETVDTFSETIQFINQSGLPYYHPYLFYYTGNTLVHRERKTLGLEGLGLAWRHHTMDSMEASRLMAQMVERVDQSFTDGQAYVEEIYKLLRGEGYAPAEIRKLFRLKRGLQLSIKGIRAGERGSETEKILSELETLVR
ncbi:MAG: radical SAM protein [Deltaproteobacteria bacterium]|nr:radical SAM protein [Deltaproteobacteria bacterium]